jgi:hypothetical protein
LVVVAVAKTATTVVNRVARIVHRIVDNIKTAAMTIAVTTTVAHRLIAQSQNSSQHHRCLILRQPTPKPARLRTVARTSSTQVSI